MKTALIVATLVELTLLVLVLAFYLIAIARALRKVSATLGLVTFGVRAIEKQTQPIGPVLGEINGALEQVAGALQGLVGAKPAATSEEPPMEPVVGPESRSVE